MSKSKIFWLSVSAIFLLLGIGYSYEYYQNSKLLTEADTLYKEGKFEKALPIYEKMKEGFWGTHSSESWAGTYDISRLQKEVVPSFERAKKAIKNTEMDSLLVAFYSLKTANTRNLG